MDDLAERQGVDPLTAGHYFHEVFDVLATSTGWCIQWTDRRDIFRIVPGMFRDLGFGHCTCIIDYDGRCSLNAPPTGWPKTCFGRHTKTITL